MKKNFILLTLVVSALAWHEAHHSMLRSNLSNLTIENIEALTNGESAGINDRNGFKLKKVYEEFFNPYTNKTESRIVGICCQQDNWYSCCNAGLQTGDCN